MLLALVLQACNLPMGVVEAGAPDFNLTMTANAALLETAQAQGLQPPADAAQPNVVEPAPAGIDAPPPTEAAGSPITNTATPTATSGLPMVTVSTATNCRTGPGQAYGISYGLPVGQAAEVVGKNSSTNYWIIKIPNGAGTCWLWGQYATVTGDTGSLPTVAIPPTPTPTITPTSTVAPLPAAPSNTSAVLLTCVTNNFTQTLTVTVTWVDNSNNESGFNIYANANFVDGSSVDQLLNSVGPNTTSYTVTATTVSKSPSIIKVEAFNSAGSSTRVSASPLNLSSCP